MAEDVSITEFHRVTAALTPSFVSAVCESGNGDVKDKLQELFNTIAEVDSKKDENKSEKCTIESCAKEQDANILRCDKCKEFTHFECTDLPGYLLYLFSSKCHKRYRCKGCVGVVPETFNEYSKEIVVGINTANIDSVDLSETINIKNSKVEEYQAEIASLKEDIGEKDKVINTLEEAVLVKSKTIDSKDEIIENLGSRICNLEVEIDRVQNARLSNNLTSDNAAPKENENINGQGEANRGVMINIESEYKEDSENITHATSKEETETIKKHSDTALSSELINLPHQLEKAELLNRDLKRNLKDQAVILHKTELAFDSKTELLNAKDEIIENLKLIVQYQKCEIAKHDNISNMTPEPIRMNAAEKSIRENCAFIHAHGTNGTILNGFLLWADIFRKVVPENMWKLQASKNFTEQEITQAKDTLWSTVGEEVIGKHTKRQGTNKSQTEISDICVALNMLSEGDRLPLFLSTSTMIASTPIYLPSSPESEGMEINRRLQTIEESLTNVIETDFSNTINTRLKTMEEALNATIARNDSCKDTDNRLKTMEESINSLTASVMSVKDVTAALQLPEIKEGDMPSNKLGKSVSWADVVSSNVSGANCRGNANDGGMGNSFNKEVRFIDPRMQGANVPDFEHWAPQEQLPTVPTSTYSYVPVNFTRYEGNPRDIDRNVIYGTNQNSSLSAADVDMVVFKVAKDVTCYQIATYAESKGIKVVNCELLTTWCEARSNTFKLTVKAQQEEAALCETVWPLGVGVRRFRQKKGDLQKTAQSERRPLQDHNSGYVRNRRMQPIGGEQGTRVKVDSFGLGHDPSRRLPTQSRFLQGQSKASNIRRNPISQGTRYGAVPRNNNVNLHNGEMSVNDGITQYSHQVNDGMEWLRQTSDRRN